MRFYWWQLQATMESAQQRAYTLIWVAKHCHGPGGPGDALRRPDAGEMRLCLPGQVLGFFALASIIGDTVITQLAADSRKAQRTQCRQTSGPQAHPADMSACSTHLLHLCYQILAGFLFGRYNFSVLSFLHLDELINTFVLRDSWSSLNKRHTPCT